MIDHSPNPKWHFPWRLFWLLLILGVLGALSVIPLAIDLFGSIDLPAEPLPLPLPLLVAIGVLQNLILLGLIVGVGLRLSSKLGFEAPLFESLVYGRQSSANTAQTVKLGVVTGVGVGVVLLGALLVLAPRLPNMPFVTAAKLAVWKRFLACFYGGIYEELLTRLFLLTLLAWVLNRTWRKQPGQLSSAAFWIANLMVAILFGLGHLPSASLVMEITQITPLVIIAALLLNGIAAIPFGYIYRLRGLEAAMIAHFAADFVVYVVGANLLKT